MANRVLTAKSRPVLIAARIEDDPCVCFRYRFWCLRVLRLRNPYLPSTATRSKIPWFLLSWLIIVKTGRGQSFRPIETFGRLRRLESPDTAVHPPKPTRFRDEGNLCRWSRRIGGVVDNLCWQILASNSEIYA